MPRIVCDIDGTVLEQGEPVGPVIDWVKANSEEVIFLTNRPESERERTVSDLERTGIAYERLVMNDGDEPAPVFKARVVSEWLADGMRIDYFIDDSEANRDAVEALGVDVVDPKDIVESEADKDGSADAPFSAAPIGDSTMDLSNFKTPEAKLAAAIEAASAAVTERDTLRADFEALTAKNLELTASAEASAKDVEAKVSAALAERDAAVAQIAELTAKVSALEAESKSVAIAAAQKVSAIGLKEPLPIAASAPAGKDSASILEQYAALTDRDERLAFYEANKRAIHAAQLKA